MIKKITKIYPLLMWVLIPFIILSSLMLYLFFDNQNKIKSLISESLQENKALINSISISSNGKNKYFVVTSDISKSLEQQQKYEFEKFMEKYYEVQSNWLNMWLTILAIIIGIMGIVVPICFMKFFEDKKNNINALINETKDVQKNIKNKEKELNTLYKEKEKDFTDLYKNFRKIAKEEFKEQQKISNLTSEIFKYLSPNTENFDLALEKSKELISIDNKNEWGYYGKARSLLAMPDNKGDLNIALLNIEEAIKINDKERLFFITKAEIYIGLRKMSDALQIYESIEKKDSYVLSNIVELEIILNKINNAQKNLQKLFDKISNDGDKIDYNILKSEMMCIENRNIEEIKNFIIEKIFSINKDMKIKWSFSEINDELISKKSSFLQPQQKINLKEMINFIKQENILREQRNLSLRKRLENFRRNRN